MENSILKSIKGVLGYDVDEAFDLDIMMHINTVFATLTDLGVGPDAGFMITGDDETWAELLGNADLTLNRVQTYVYLQVRLYFDPPGTSYHLNAVQEQVKELEYRLSTHREGLEWVAPSSLPSLP